MKKLFILLMLLPMIGYNQVSNYSYLATTSTWTYNSSPTAITGLGAAINDALSSAINIGFTFYYQQVAYTQFKASTNGFITFNTANTLAQPTNNLKTSTERVIVAPLWDDNQTGASGNVNYKLTGTTPNRVLTVEWKALRWNKSGFSAGTIDCQTKLYETSNLIEFVYNRGTYQSFSNSTGIGASIGLSGSVSGDFMSISDLKPSPTMSTTTETITIGASPTNLMPLTAAQATTAIPNGTMFRMTPPPIALPIELLYFNVDKREGYNHLTWSTSSEHNNDYFNIEKTQDGVIYYNISTINGSGSSNNQSYYEYDDYDVNGDINYYRLKQTDFDGVFKYHDIISVDNSSNKIRIIVRVINLYGTEVDIKTKGVLILIYDDGTIKKLFNE
jgi:hypothetical protein